MHNSGACVGALAPSARFAGAESDRRARCEACRHPRLLSPCSARKAPPRHRAKDRGCARSTLASQATPLLCQQTCPTSIPRADPSRPVRTRLAWVISELNQGRPWCDAFRSARLFTTADVELFRIAERIGNLEWALDEASESTLRRVAFRLRVVANLVLPWIVILMGLLVGFVVVALFMPLVSLIQGMS